MKIIAFGTSDVGKIRRNNEDSYVVDDGLRLYAVADGIGGHEGGEVASRLAIEGLLQVAHERFPRAGEKPLSEDPVMGDPVTSLLMRAFARSNRLIRQSAADNPALAGMGTTLTALLLSHKAAYIAHIGDSRAYLLRSGSLSRVTEDHSVVAEHIRAGLLTPDEARKSPYRHIITRSLGLEPDPIADERKIEINKHDIFLLCTDGLTEMVEDAEISWILASSSPQGAVEGLIRLANDRGGVDNITVVVIKIEDPPVE